MDFFTWKGQKIIRQKLTYRNKNGETSGVHTTYYDPKTLSVQYWSYKNASKSFAFKMDGTKISGTQNIDAPEDTWKTLDIGTMLFQNETRELFFRAVQVQKGTIIKFPVIGTSPPFHGWISYTYAKDQTLEYKGKVYNAKVWEATGNPKSYYIVIDKAPYVIKRVVFTGKDTHIFTYQ